jgi:hypothetical protein
MSSIAATAEAGCSSLGAMPIHPVSNHIYILFQVKVQVEKKSHFATPRKLTGNPIRMTLN